MAITNEPWWKSAVCYQVWPASFKDSNGDGIGDIPGIISKLDYLKSLGIDAIWLSPMYDSPKHDCGYDIRNYEDVDPDFGTLADMDALIKGLHDRGMKIMLDLVVNHTSDEHKWFQESKKSKDNEYSDYYIWRDPKIVDGKKVEPNNWVSIFGGSTWEYVPERDQYYFHLFLDSQPDVNWENEKVRKAIYETAIHFWLKRGVDGFRVDAVNVYSKDQDYPDAPVVNPDDLFHGPHWPSIQDGPRMHEWLQEQRREAFDPYGDIVLIGEGGGTTDEKTLAYIDPKKRELDMVFEMSVVWPEEFNAVSREDRDGTFSLHQFRRGWDKSQRLLRDYGCWLTTFLENHDNQRSIPKFGSPDPEFYWKSGELLALLLATLSGTLFIYQGQEIGMSGVPKDWTIEDMRDKWWTGAIQETLDKYPGDEKQKQRIMNAFQVQGRDHSRTPVQWSGEENAGFTTGKPWMKVNPNYKEVNVADQEKDWSSLWSFYKEVIAFRKENPEFAIFGHTRFVDCENEKVLYYTKSLADGKPLIGGGPTRWLVVLNFTDEKETMKMPSELNGYKLGKPLIGTPANTASEELAPREGRVYELF